jgi:hypothetical protein
VNASRLADIVFVYTSSQINEEIQLALGEMKVYADYANNRAFESEADLYERLVTAQEIEAELRAEVRKRLTPVGWVEIPGLGVSVPVYA